MSRLYDRIMDLQVKPGLNPFYQKLYEEIAGSVVVVADNVSRYLFEENDKEIWGFDDFPNVAPLAPKVFVETAPPRFIESAMFGRRPWSMPDLRSWGTLLRAVPIRDALEKSLAAAAIANSPKATSALMTTQARWVLECHVLIETKDGGVVYNAMTVLPVMGDGSIGERSLCADLVAVDRSAHSHELAKGVQWPLLNPVLLAVSLAHCKNVRLEEQQSPRHERRQTERAGKPPLTKFYTLEIDPMRTVLRTEGRSGEHGLQKALHICRGHFKDYREHGLFGRNKGLYWWDAHVRGTAERGTVVKDYAIKT